MPGKWFFRWRGVIGTVGFGVVIATGRPLVSSLAIGAASILAGLAMRYWAAGCLGRSGRVREVGAEELVRSGPYRWFPHPLYLGNLLIVIGMLIGLRPPSWLAVAVVAGFLVEYGFIIAAERRFLAGRELPVANRGFESRRALYEWPTWVVTGIAWMLGLAKALLATR